MTAVAVETFQWHRWGLIAPETPPPAPSYAAEQLADGPLIQLRLEEATGLPQDSSGNARHVTSILGSLGLTFGVPGLLGDASKATDFTAAGAGQLRIAHGDWMKAVAALTLTARVKLGTVAGGYRAIVSRRITNGTTQNTWSFRVTPSGQLQSLIWISSSTVRQVTTTYVLDTNPHTVAVSYDGRWTRIYVDGAEVHAVDHGTVAAVTGATTADVSVGAWGSNQEPFVGVLDEVCWFGAALAPTRLAAHHAAATAAPAPAPAEAAPGWVVDVDRSAALVAWAVDYGRGDSLSRTQPLQVTTSLAADLAGPCPEIGERFRLTLSDADAATLGISPTGPAVRFTGEVTDAVHDTVREVYTVTGVGRLGRTSRRAVDPRWPVEDDGARVGRLLAAAEVEVGAVDPGTVALARQAPASAGALLDQVVESTGGQVVEQLTGEVDWHDAEHRRGAATPTVTLDAAELLNDVTWQQHVGEVVNDVEVAWTGGTVTARDPFSVEARETFPGRVSTILTTASDAHSLGSLVLARRRDPVWQLPALVVDLYRTVTAEKLAALLALRHGDRVQVTGLPAGGPYVGTAEFFVEGHRETAVGRGRHGAPTWRLALAVSDPALSGVSLRWIDAPAALTWDQVDPALTWLDVATLTDPNQLGA